MRREERENILRRMMSWKFVPEEERQALKAILDSEAKLLEACKALLDVYGDPGVIGPEGWRPWRQAVDTVARTAIADADPPEVPAKAKSAVKGGD
jgi:hypothetical protein